MFEEQKDKELSIKQKKSKLFKIETFEVIFSHTHYYLHKIDKIVDIHVQIPYLSL